VFAETWKIELVSHPFKNDITVKKDPENGVARSSMT